MVFRMAHPDLIQSAEAARICRVDRQRFNKWAKDGKVPVHAILDNGYRLFNRADIEAFAATLVPAYRLPDEVDA